MAWLVVRLYAFENKYALVSGTVLGQESQRQPEVQYLASTPEKSVP
jgi:hypothetical protein